MRTTGIYTPRWRKRFAWFPVIVSDSDTEVWLESYWELGDSVDVIEKRLLENPPPMSESMRSSLSE